MRRWLLASGVLILAGSLAVTTAYTQDASGEKPKKTAVRHMPKPKVDADGHQISPFSLAQRTANAKKDCAPGVGTHGVYRGYTQWDPELKSIEGKKLYAACIKRGLEPAPGFAVHRFAYAIGVKSVFGRTKENCLECHSKGY